jgi:hypothetical protein
VRKSEDAARDGITPNEVTRMRLCLGEGRALARKRL